MGRRSGSVCICVNLWLLLRLQRLEILHGIKPDVDAMRIAAAEGARDGAQVLEFGLRRSSHGKVRCAARLPAADLGVRRRPENDLRGVATADVGDVDEDDVAGGGLILEQ